MFTAVAKPQRSAPTVIPDSVLGDFKFLMRPTSERSGAVLVNGQKQDVNFLRTMIIGVMPTAFLKTPGEELWDCDITLQSCSVKSAQFNLDLGNIKELTVPARLYIRHQNQADGQATTIVIGAALHSVSLCNSGVDEMWTGQATVTAIRKYDGTSAFLGFRADQVMCSTEFESPEKHLKRIFGNAPV